MSAANANEIPAQVDSAEVTGNMPDFVAHIKAQAQMDQGCSVFTCSPHLVFLGVSAKLMITDGRDENKENWVVQVWKY